MMRLRVLGLFLFIAGVCCPVARAQAQWSPAFLPGAYLPTVGVPGEIDTIYGWDKVYRGFGWGMRNIGPPFVGGYGSIACFGFLPDTFNFRSFAGGASFNIHSLHFDGRINFDISAPMGAYSIVHIGPIRARNSRDIVVADPDGYKPPRIYWEGDDGSYDSSRYTIIKVDDHKQSPQELEIYYRDVVCGHFLSDTIEDIIFEVNFLHKSSDTIFLCFKGGGRLFAEGPKNQLADSTIIAEPFNTLAYCPLISGEFHGDIRSDIIRFSLQDSSSIGRNAFYLKNDTPFSLSRLVSQWKDTLISESDNPEITYSNSGRGTWAFQALQHPHDNAEDAVFHLFSANKSEGFYIFRGSPDFGSHRLTLDSAAFVIPHPSKFDGSFSQHVMHDNLRLCSDMSGKHVPMLCIEGNIFATEEYFFYGLGAGLSDHASAYFNISPEIGMGNYFDTLTADGDNLEDMVFGMNSYSNTGNEFDGSGAILVMHGSHKIPIQLNQSVPPKYDPIPDDCITVSPNPVHRHTVVTWESACSGEVNVRLVDLLGRTVFEETQRTTGDLESLSLDLPPLPAGDYLLDLVQEPCTQHAKVTVLP